jgi:hypothetical protein
MSTISTMSTIQPREGHEHEYFQRAETVKVSRATKEQVRGMPKDVPWSQGVGKAYSLSAMVEGSTRSVIISTWKNSEPFLYPEFTKKSSGPPMNITGDLGRLTPYVSRTGQTIDPARSHVTTYNRERESRKAGAESAVAPELQGSTSGTVHHVRAQDESHQTMDTFIDSMCFEGEQHPEDLDTFLKGMEETFGPLRCLSYLQ